jgi:hypothetical protein
MRTKKLWLLKGVSEDYPDAIPVSDIAPLKNAASNCLE